MLYCIKQSYLANSLVTGLLSNALYLGNLYSGYSSYLGYSKYHGLSMQKSQRNC
ncbi:hypothetical protein [Psychrobacter sp. I-STPA6b]|uniref:hypothetical protein n=1 Tax=Psychrobacter sp. I-STPA6b TaxID=2585718 RepID=UPI001D0C1F5D|nr:hypothetical protein [Psychrobacter sp. I-STPA6b]